MLLQRHPRKTDMLGKGGRHDPSGRSKVCVRHGEAVHNDKAPLAVQYPSLDDGNDPVLTVEYWGQNPRHISRLHDARLHDSRSRSFHSLPPGEKAPCAYGGLHRRFVTATLTHRSSVRSGDRAASFTRYSSSPAHGASRRNPPGTCADCRCLTARLFYSGRGISGRAADGPAPVTKRGCSVPVMPQGMARPPVRAGLHFHPKHPQPVSYLRPVTSSALRDGGASLAPSLRGWRSYSSPTRSLPTSRETIELNVSNSPEVSA